MGKKLSAYNLHMKRELKGKMKGKTKAQRKAIFKTAARAWKSKKKGNSKPRSKPKSASSKRSSSKTGGHKKVGKFNMSKIYGLMRKGALVAPALIIAAGTASPQEKLRIGVKSYFAFDPVTGQVNFQDLWRGWGPFVGSVFTTYGIPKLISIIRGL